MGTTIEDPEPTLFDAGGTRGLACAVHRRNPVLSISSRRCRAVAAALTVTAALAACGGGGDDGEKSASPATTTAPATTAPPAAKPDVKLNASVVLKPAKVGTPEQPQPVQVAVDLRVRTPVDSDPVSATGVELTIPSGVVFRPGSMPVCTPEALDAEGPSGCPRGAQLGTGTVRAAADTNTVEGDVTAFFGGDDRVLLRVEISNPVIVGATIAGRLVEQSDGGYQLGLEIPKELQQVAGLPIVLDRLRLTLGRGDVLATTACPDGGLPFAARLAFTGDVKADTKATAECGR